MDWNQAQDLKRIAMAQERIAVAVEQLVDLVKEETKIGGALDIARAIGRVGG